MTRLRPVRGKKDITLGDGAAHVHGRVKHGPDLESAMQHEGDRIADLQKVLYADARYGLLIVLQGRDASGKDGTIRRVFSAVNPQGCQVTSFGVPSEAEQMHDYLWRVHQAVPSRRMIGIFNRSHYEDVIVPRVHGTLSKKRCERRYEEINDFERMLTDNHVVVLKFMLHVSRDEQKKRLQERLENPQKNWKFREGDLEDRRNWDAFTKAYRGVLSSTSTKWAPWYIVPSDDAKVRDWLVARCIADTLASLGLRYPKAEPSLRRLKGE